MTRKTFFCIAFSLGCSTLMAQQTYTLDQLIDSAFKNNLSLRAAQLDVDAARQQRQEAFTNYFPNISGIGLWFNANRGMAKMEMNPSEMIPASLGTTIAQLLPAEAMAALASPFSMSMMKNGTIAGVTAMQPVFAGGQIVNGNRLARVGEDVSKLQLQLSENEVERQTTAYYWQLVSLEEKMKTIHAVETLLSDILKDVTAAVDAGVAMRNDLLQVQLRQNETESQKLQLQNGIDLMKMLVAQYCGLSPNPSRMGEGSGYSYNVEVPDLDQQDYSLPTLQREEMGERLSLLPEYQLLQKQVEAATLQKRMAFGQNLPSVAVGAGYNYHNLLENDRTFGMIFATVSVPISSWWGGSHAVKRKKIEQQKAIDQLADNAELLSIRMQKAANDVTEARQQLALAERSIEQTTENLRLNRDYYQAGTSKMSDLLEAQLLYQQSLDKRVDAFATLQNRLIEYRQATNSNP